MESEYDRYRKNVGMSALFDKSYKNTRTKKEAALTVVPDKKTLTI